MSSLNTESDNTCDLSLRAHVFSEITNVAVLLKVESRKNVYNRNTFIFRLMLRVDAKVRRIIVLKPEKVENCSSCMLLTTKMSVLFKCRVSFHF